MYLCNFVLLQDPSEPAENAPRQTGSMTVHAPEDKVSRIKNIRCIGKYNILFISPTIFQVKVS